MVQAIQAREQFIKQHKLRPSMLACDAAAVRVSFELDRLLLSEAA